MDPLQPQTSGPVVVEAHSNNNVVRIAIAVIIILLAILGGLYLLGRGSEGGVSSEPVVPNGEEAEGVDVSHINLSAAGEDKLPPGFPSGIPVEQGNLTESYKAVYEAQGVTQYTVSFSSVKPKDSLWDEYNQYMASEEYEANAEGTSKAQGTLRGALGASEFYAVISSNAGRSYVQLNYIERQQ